MISRELFADLRKFIGEIMHLVREVTNVLFQFPQVTSSCHE